MADPPEPDPGSSARREVETGSAPAARGGSTSGDARLDDGKTEVGRGLESVGDMTADALQRSASAVESAAKPPVVDMGALANPPSSSPGTPLVERVGRLEAQMAVLDERAEWGLSHPRTPRSMEKLRTARSLLQETEAKGTLVERVQLLEDRLAEYMERYEKDISNVQPKFAHVKVAPGSADVNDAGELSLSGDEFHDAEQGSGNLDLPDLGSDAHGEARGHGLAPQEALVKEASPEEPRGFSPKESSAAATSESAAKDASEVSSLTSSVDRPEEKPVKEPATTVEPPKGGDAVESPAVLSYSEPQPQGALSKEPSTAEASADVEEPAGQASGATDETGAALAGTEAPLAPTADEPRGSSPTKSSAAATSESAAKVAPEASSLTPSVDKPEQKPVKEPATSEEPPQGGDADESPVVLSSSEPQPQGAPAKMPLMAEARAQLEGPAAEPRHGSATGDKHVHREYEYKAAEDVKAPDEKPGSFTKFIMGPKHREKKKTKENREKRHEGLASSFRAEEQRPDSVAEDTGRTNSLRAEERSSKPPLKHLRDRIKRALRSNKGS